MCSLFRDITGGQETGTALFCTGVGGRRRADWPVRSAAAGLPAEQGCVLPEILTTFGIGNRLQADGYRTRLRYKVPVRRGGEARRGARTRAGYPYVRRPALLFPVPVRRPHETFPHRRYRARCARLYSGAGPCDRDGLRRGGGANGGCASSFRTVRARPIWCGSAVRSG